MQYAGVASTRVATGITAAATRLCLLGPPPEARGEHSASTVEAAASVRREVVL